MNHTRLAALVALCALALTVVACSPSTGVGAATGSSGDTTSTAQRPGLSEKPFFILNKDLIYRHATLAEDPAKYPSAAMDGEPSQIPFFRPQNEEGVKPRIYPAYDAKTFKFLSLPGTMIAPQDYYMLQKNGGSVNAALAGSGYKAAEILDTAHEKILPNFYLGYYDFAWVSIDVVSEVWSGNVSVYPELWRQGDDYVIIAGAVNRGVDLIGPPDLTDVSQLAGKKVGIMNPGFNFEMALDKKLKTAGLSTESDGGNVGIEMGTPGYVMNDLIDRKIAAVFPWAAYSSQLVKQFGFHTIVPWKEMGYGSRMPSWVLLVRKDILAKHPDIVQKVVQLNYDASKQALAVGDYKEPERARRNKFASEFMGDEHMPNPAQLDDFGKGVDPQANPVFLHDLVDYMTRMKYFKVPYTYGQLVDQSFNDKVQK